MEQPKPPKTWKRETAWALLLFWAYITRQMFVVVDPEHIRAYEPAYTIASMAVWTFALGAFGMDWAVKQLGWRAK